MSSEMRELVAEMRTEMETNLTGFGIYPKIRAMCDKIESLLARTEAGADGRIDHHKAMQALEDLDDCARMDRGIAATGPYDLLRRYIMQQNRTHPHDASGDAVTGRVNGYMFSARAIEIITDGEVPEWITKTPGLRVTITAMQAKEAAE